MCFNTQFYKMGFKERSIIMNVGDLRLLKRELVLKGIYDLTFEKDF